MDAARCGGFHDINPAAGAAIFARRWGAWIHSEAPRQTPQRRRGAAFGGCPLLWWWQTSVQVCRKVWQDGCRDGRCSRCSATPRGRPRRLRCGSEKRLSIPILYSLPYLFSIKESRSSEGTAYFMHTGCTQEVWSFAEKVWQVWQRAERQPQPYNFAATPQPGAMAGCGRVWHYPQRRALWRRPIARRRGPW